MSQLSVIEAIKSDDVQTLARLLSEGGDANERDENGWTPLNWAAGKGDVAQVKLLLDHGADITLTGRDERTPLMIAKAASRGEVVELLSEAEKQRGVWDDPRRTRPYCKAYYLGDLRKFASWSENRINWKEEEESDGGAGVEQPLTDDDVAYLHQDFTVTKSMWHGESVIFDQVTPEWQEFSETDLQFAIPDDLL